MYSFGQLKSGNISRTSIFKMFLPQKVSFDKQLLLTYCENIVSFFLKQHILLIERKQNFQGCSY